MKNFWNTFIKVDGRAAPYGEHVVHWFITLAVVFAALTFAFHHIIAFVIFLIASLIAGYFTFKADKRINGNGS